MDSDTGLVGSILSLEQEGTRFDSTARRGLSGMFSLHLAGFPPGAILSPHHFKQAQQTNTPAR